MQPTVQWGQGALQQPMPQAMQPHLDQPELAFMQAPQAPATATAAYPEYELAVEPITRDTQGGTACGAPNVPRLSLPQFQGSQRENDRTGAHGQPGQPWTNGWMESPQSHMPGMQAAEMAPFDHHGWQPHNPEVIPGHGHELYTGHEAPFSGPRCPPDPPVPAFAADLVGPTASQVPAAHFMPEAPCDASNGPTDTSTKGRRPGLTSMGSCNILCDEPPVPPLPFASAAPRPSMRKPLVNPPSLEVFRATHGLPPCDDESYDPYGPYGDLGDVETDEAPYPLDEPAWSDDPHGEMNQAQLDDVGQCRMCMDVL